MFPFCFGNGLQHHASCNFTYKKGVPPPHGFAAEGSDAEHLGRSTRRWDALLWALVRSWPLFQILLHVSAWVRYVAVRLLSNQDQVLQPPAWLVPKDRLAGHTWATDVRCDLPSGLSGQAMREPKKSCSILWWSVWRLLQQLAGKGRRPGKEEKVQGIGRNRFSMPVERTERGENG